MEGRTCEDCAANPSRFESVTKIFAQKKKALCLLFLNGSSGEGLRWRSSKTIKYRFAYKNQTNRRNSQEPMEGRTCEDCAANPSRFESVTKIFAQKKKALCLLFLNGSSGGTRTYNPSVNSRMLCH